VLQLPVLPAERTPAVTATAATATIVNG
jgi:hypothetical protein